MESATAWQRVQRAAAPCREASGAIAVLLLTLTAPPVGTAADLAQLRENGELRAAAVEANVIAWRRYIHQHPELSNRELQTAALVAEELQGFGLEVRTGVAHTGVVGVLRGGQPGPVVALRADMDALTITEEAEVPFRSVQRGTQLSPPADRSTAFAEVAKNLMAR